MIRGAQKRIVVIKTADSAIFDEAYFVLKSGRETNDGDMVKEANRIVESVDRPSGYGEDFGKRAAFGKVAFFICGLGAGSLITAVLSGIAVMLGG